MNIITQKMKILVLCITALFLFSIILCHEKNSDNADFPTNSVSSILKLDAEIYQKKFKQTENLFVFYYSPFCGYSVKMAGALVQLSTFIPQFNLEGKKIQLAQFNINNDKETAEDLKVEGSPAFRYYIKGKFIKEHEGARTAIGIFNFILHCLDLYSIELTNNTQLEAFTTFHENVLVYFGDSANISSYKNAIKTDLSDELLVGHVLHDIKRENSEDKKDIDELISKNNISKTKNTVHLFKQKKVLDNNFYPIKVNNTEDYSKIHEFLSVNLYSHILKFDEPNSKLIFSQGKAALFFYSSPKDYQKYYSFIIEELPHSVREKMLIFLLGHEDNEDIEGRFYSVVHASHADFPSVKIHKREEVLMTETMQGEITADNVIKFVNNWLTNGFSHGVKDREEKTVEKDDL